MTREQYHAIDELLPDIHEKMSNEIPSRVQDSIFTQLNLVGKNLGTEEFDEVIVIAHAIVFAMYGFRPGGQTVAESYAEREAAKAEGELREYLNAIGNTRFSIFRVLDSVPDQDELQVQLRDELYVGGEKAVWFGHLGKLQNVKNAAGLLIAGYIIPIFGGHMHISGMLTASDELLADAVAKKSALGGNANKRSGQAELTKFITRRAIHEEIELRERRAYDAYDEDE